jgi:hypothetical protein
VRFEFVSTLHSNAGLIPFSELSLRAGVAVGN